jgi:hypothetical protein
MMKEHSMHFIVAQQTVKTVVPMKDSRFILFWGFSFDLGRVCLGGFFGHTSFHISLLPLLDLGDLGSALPSKQDWCMWISDSPTVHVIKIKSSINQINQQQSPQQ